MGYQSNQLFVIKHFQDILSHQPETEHLESEVRMFKNISNFLIPPGRLSRVEPGDEGQYECQVSTETKLSNIKHLQVIQPQVALRIELSPI